MENLTKNQIGHIKRYWRLRNSSVTKLKQETAKLPLIDRVCINCMVYTDDELPDAIRKLMNYIYYLDDEYVAFLGKNNMSLSDSSYEENLFQFINHGFVLINCGLSNCNCNICQAYVEEE